MTAKTLMPLLAALALGAAPAPAAEPSFKPQVMPLQPVSPPRPTPPGAAQGMLPDLVLDDLLLDESCHVVVQLRNDGPAALGAEIWTAQGADSVGVALKQGGVVWGTEPLWKIDSWRGLQPAGGKATYMSTLGVTGSQSITATVDAGNRVSERKETNNERTEQLHCRR